MEIDRKDGEGVRVGVGKSGLWGFRGRGGSVCGGSGGSSESRWSLGLVGGAFPVPMHLPACKAGARGGGS